MSSFIVGVILSGLNAYVQCDQHHRSTDIRNAATSPGGVQCRNGDTADVFTWLRIPNTAMTGMLCLCGALIGTACVGIPMLTRRECGVFVGP